MGFNHGIIDGHVHTHGGFGVDGYLRNVTDHLSASGLDGENLICVKHGRSACITEADALVARAMFPHQYTIYGHPVFLIPGFDGTPEGVARQAKDMLEAGFDGIKLADGNGGEKEPLDSGIFDPLFSTLEHYDAPLLYHVATTPVFPPRRTFQKNRFPVENPPFLLYQKGIDDDHPARDGLPREILHRKFAEMDRILARHPKLKLTLPHFYFMSDDLDRLSAFLDSHPRVNIDLTPCPEIYYNLSRNPGKSREFLCDYRNRVNFGTDNDTSSDPLVPIMLMRRFLETDDTFFAVRWGFDMTGVKLPREVLADIYRNTFLSIQREHRLDSGKAADYCEKIYDTVKDFTELPEENKQEVLECARRLRSL
ncbi:MAG: amidohydrolase family protein [Firmicutes bacterium]|nr:amidohydrolase family protein [Bacillota bacterium]